MSTGTQEKIKDVKKEASQTLQQPAESKESQKEPKLNGAFISVLTVGAIITVMWFAVYLLFLNS